MYNYTLLPVFAVVVVGGGGGGVFLTVVSVS